VPGESGLHERVDSYRFGMSGSRTQRVAPGALVALKRALTAIYWYKPDLRGFLRNALRDATLLSRLDWDDYKRNIVGTLVDHLAASQPHSREELVGLMLEVARMDDFSHLRRLDDGEEKMAEARAAVAALRDWTKDFQADVAAQAAAEEVRAEAQARAERQRAVDEARADVKARFYALVSSENPQARGTELERLMRALFELYDLAPRAAFVLRGEQIDGAFELDHTPFLFEAKWTQAPIQPKELRDFAGKIEEKLENTLGLFLSINGFTDAAVESQSSRAPRMLLMDGADLMVVLDRGLDLVDMLRAKRRHASQTGQVFLAGGSLL
jgi:restriction endonuclease Mrr